MLTRFPFSLVFVVGFLGPGVLFPNCLAFRTDFDEDVSQFRGISGNQALLTLSGYLFWDTLCEVALKFGDFSLIDG